MKLDVKFWTVLFKNLYFKRCKTLRELLSYNNKPNELAKSIIEKFESIVKTKTLIDNCRLSAKFIDVPTVGRRTFAYCISDCENLF
jgi:hypothetical protein